MVALRPLADALAAGNPIHGLILGIGREQRRQSAGQGELRRPQPGGTDRRHRGRLSRCRDLAGDHRIRGGPRHGHPTRRPRRGRCPDRGLPSSHGADRLLLAGIGQGQRRASVRQRGRRQPDQGVPRPVAPDAAAARELRARQSPDRLRRAAPSTSTPTRVRGRRVRSPRRAAVSSFGFGGSNVHVVLEEHLPRSAA